MSDPVQRFNAIVADFETALSTLSEVLQHIENAKPPARLRVVILNNTIVALTATIEETLRGLFSEYLSILEECILDHRQLRKTLQRANLECAVQILDKYRREFDFKSAANLVSNLEKCLNGQPGYSLLKEQITYNQANFRSRQVTEISKNVGLPGLWMKICDCPEVEEFTGEVLVEARVTRLTASWNEFFNERDLVVHRISQATGWGADRIQRSISLGRLVVTRVASCLTDDGNGLIPAALPAAIVATRGEDTVAVGHS